MRFISRNTRPPERRPHGLTLDDVRGLIRKPVSYWAIDESGNPSRKPKQNGKPFTLSAVTELSPIDYDRLLEGVPLYDGEVHFSKLRNEHPDICISLMTNFGNENILIVSKTVMKRGKTVHKSKRRGPPTDELYLLSLLNELVEAVSEIDLSDSVIVTYDRNDNIRDGACLLLWSDRRVFVLGDSSEYRLIQMADLASSSLGKMLLPDGFADSCYFEKIKAKTVNLQNGTDDRWPTRTDLTEKEWENGDRPQHSLTFLPHDCRDSEYLTGSEPAQKGSRISKNAKIGRKCPGRTETRDIPQYRPARLQSDATYSGYLIRSEQKRPGLADCTQHSAFAPWVSDSGSDYKEPHRCDPFGSKCAKKRCIQCN